MAKKIGHLAIERDSNGIFIIADGVKIARRGHPGTAEAKTWVLLEPGWSVVDRPPDEIEIMYEGKPCGGRVTGPGLH
jgi:hypothetical protein